MAASLNPKIVLLAFGILLTAKAKAQSLAWAQAIVGGKASVITGTTDTAGNLYTVGAFGGTVDFDWGPGVSNLTAVSNFDMFVMKEDRSGNLIWVKQVKGLSSGVYGCYGNAIDVDKNGSVFITGSFRDSFDFDPGPAVYKLASFGSYHTFILKLDSAGNFVWVKDLGFQIPSVNIQATAQSEINTAICILVL